MKSVIAFILFCILLVLLEISLWMIPATILVIICIVGGIIGLVYLKG